MGLFVKSFVENQYVLPSKVSSFVISVPTIVTNASYNNLKIQTRRGKIQKVTGQAPLKKAPTKLLILSLDSPQE